MADAASTLAALALDKMEYALVCCDVTGAMGTIATEVVASVGVSEGGAGPVAIELVPGCDAVSVVSSVAELNTE